MNLSYRTRQRISRLFKGLVIAIIIAAIVWLCWIIWVGRYIVYTKDGARLDFSLSPTFPSGQVAGLPTKGPTVHIVYDEPQESLPLPPVDEKIGINGYYVDPAQLKSDIPGLLEQLKTLPKGTAVLLDVKDIKGHFYYTSTSGKESKDVDTQQMDQLLSWLLNSELYVIGRVPAFQDYEFGLNNVDYGLPKKDGNGSLWLDKTTDNYTYWLNPASNGALDYIIQVTMELRLMGFDEVVYTDFRFPDTDQIRFEGDKAQAIADAAQLLADTCSTGRFWVSFQSTDPAFPLPNGSSRLYLQGVAADNLDATVDQVQTLDPRIHLLFLTDTHDNRFEKYCYLRPMDMAD